MFQRDVSKSEKSTPANIRKGDISPGSEIECEDGTLIEGDIGNNVTIRCTGSLVIKGHIGSEVVVESQGAMTIDGSLCGAKTKINCGGPLVITGAISSGCSIHHQDTAIIKGWIAPGVSFHHGLYPPILLGRLSHGLQLKEDEQATYNGRMKYIKKTQAEERAIKRVDQVEEASFGVLPAKNVYCLDGEIINGDIGEGTVIHALGALTINGDLKNSVTIKCDGPLAINGSVDPHCNIQHKDTAIIKGMVATYVQFQHGFYPPVILGRVGRISVTEDKEATREARIKYLKKAFIEEAAKLKKEIPEAKTAVVPQEVKAEEKVIAKIGQSHESILLEAINGLQIQFMKLQEKIEIVTDAQNQIFAAVTAPPVLEKLDDDIPEKTTTTVDCKARLFNATTSAVASPIEVATASLRLD